MSNTNNIIIDSLAYLKPSNVKVEFVRHDTVKVLAYFDINNHLKDDCVRCNSTWTVKEFVRQSLNNHQFAPISCNLDDFYKIIESFEAYNWRVLEIKWF